MAVDLAVEGVGYLDPARISASLITVISAWAALYKSFAETLSLIESAPSRQHSPRPIDDFR